MTVMRIETDDAKARGLGGLWVNADPTPEEIAEFCRSIQATWPPEEFVERRSYQEPVSPRRRMNMRLRRHAV